MSVKQDSISMVIPSTIGPAIPLTYQKGSLIPKDIVYSHIEAALLRFAEGYEGSLVLSITIRVYTTSKTESKDRVVIEETISLSLDERKRILSDVMKKVDLRKLESIPVLGIRYHNRSPPTSYITALKKASSTALKPFIVADIETVLIDNIYMPYAAGLLLVKPGEKIEEFFINTYFSEDYTIISELFEDRSKKVLFDFIKRIDTMARKAKSKVTVYFHNFSRFDGILVLKHLVCHHNYYKVKPIMRNNMLYELAVYDTGKKKYLFRFRDSLKLLPGKLGSLARHLCPELGDKGCIPYDKITPSNLSSMKNSLLDYMKQDILLLGGIMQKAQEIYWRTYGIDIESKITLSSLALTIFRLKYYDPSLFPIHIPNMNEDAFIRRAYYGGHTDVYIPYGENLYYYDVNSLYPYVMKEFPMPGGKPVWYRNLENQELNNLFGFIEAFVVCPKTLKRPFLPFRNKDDTLIFPTGSFIGVFYTEELKYARDLGYEVIPISGYLFEKMESPFKSFISSLYDSRLDAKKDGNLAMSYVYKTLMNSLYGRFGINPKSTITEICPVDRYDHLIRNSELIFADKLSENSYIVAYHSYSEKESSISSWSPPKNTAVQLAAAITASARIYMYPFISRDDCYYTDTDSVVLANPLPEEYVNSTVIGKFKLEDKIIRACFLAPKSYTYTAYDGSSVLKFKGPAKKWIHPDWFYSTYADLSRNEEILVDDNFRIDWHTLRIMKKKTSVKLGIKVGTKRIPVLKDGMWVDTTPIDVSDLSSFCQKSQLIIKKLPVLNKSEPQPKE